MGCQVTQDFFSQADFVGSLQGFCDKAAELVADRNEEAHPLSLSSWKVKAEEVAKLLQE